MRMLLILLTAVLAFGQTPDFESSFTGQTLRWDYTHTGTAGEEHIGLDQVRLEGEWPGSRRQLIDDTNLGKYLFEVTDLASGALIYSRGFASIYGEWETIGEAREGKWRSIHESQRFPEPRKPVRLTLKKRDAAGRFQTFYSSEVDPASRFVDRSNIARRGRVWKVFENGSPAEKVDLLVLGDGYRRNDRNAFRKDARRLIKALFDTEPFKSRKDDFNVWAIDVDAAEKGISNPRAGVWRDSPLGVSYNSFDSDRYALSYANRAIRDIAAQAPYDALIILINAEKYGGGGILNLYTTAAAGSGESAYLVVHEFGHSFAGLGDEYYSSDVAYEEFNPAGVEPWEPNVTALLDPAQLKWRDLLAGDTPLPTPWDQEAYDSVSFPIQERRRALRAEGADEEALEALFAEERLLKNEILQGGPYADRVGAFEGAMYQGKGLYRPETNCIMFTRHNEFCQVCARAIERVIDLYSE